MNGYNSNLMLTVLHREYPEIAVDIAERIKNTLPDQKLDDLNYMPKIVETFKRERNVKDSIWKLKTSVKSNIKITDNRELLVAVALMFYHPEKLMQMTLDNTKKGVLKALTANIGTSQELLSQTVPSAVVAFKAYEEFRTEVYRLYELIKTENKFFE